jgi:hypothetical protein
MASLAACTFVPVYGDNTSPSVQNALRFAQPANRLERIIYEELSLRIGKTESPDAPLLRITATSVSRAIGRLAVANPFVQREMTVSALVEVISKADQDDENSVDEVIFSGSREASASYTINNQLLASSFAEEEAELRAARSLADSIRLTLIAGLEGKL